MINAIVDENIMNKEINDQNNDNKGFINITNIKVYTLSYLYHI